jgi:DNA-binding transcriptional ArsR family regulator
MSPSATKLARLVSHQPLGLNHFNVLKEAGLVRARREGQQIYYALNTSVVEDLMTWLWDLFGTDGMTQDQERGKEEA